MASPAIRSVLGKYKLPLPLLIRGTTLTSPQSKADGVTACLPKESVLPSPPPPHSSVVLGDGKAWALGRMDVFNGREDGLRLGGRRPAVKEEEVDENDWIDDDDDDDDDEELKDINDSEDFDDDQDDFEDEVPRRKNK